MTTCHIEDCTKPPVGRGLCDNHYYGAKRAGTLDELAPKVFGPCSNCGGVIPQTRRWGSTFCSTTCKDKAHYEVRPPHPSRAKPRVEGRTCRECGESIDGRPLQAKFCSRLCLRRRFEREKRRQRNINLARTCPVCSVPMGDLDPGFKIYCSEKCRHLNERAKLYNANATELHQRSQDQGHRCAICRTDAPGGKGGFHVDHCHDAGVVRGLLCHHCNVALGNFKDDVELLRAAVAYLEHALN